MDEIIKAHSLYMEKVFERCLLTSKVRNLVTYILTTILRSVGQGRNKLSNEHLDIIVSKHSRFILSFHKVEVMKVGILKVLRLAVKFSKLWTLDVKENRFCFNPFNGSTLPLTSKIVSKYIYTQILLMFRESLVNTIAEDLQKWRTFIVTFLTKKMKKGSYPQCK